GGDAPADHSAIVQQVDPVLDSWQAVGDLAEVALAQVLLAMEIERAMVGRHDLQVVVDEATPELILMVRGTQRRGANELGALEAVAEILERQEEVLRTRFREGREALVAGASYLGERLGCGEMGG